jgi:hypothetical protein
MNSTGSWPKALSAQTPAASRPKAMNIVFSRPIRNSSEEGPRQPVQYAVDRHRKGQRRQGQPNKAHRRIYGEEVKFGGLELGYKR